MAKPFEYCALAVLLIVVHSSTAIFLDIHKKMTNSEKLAVFGSEDSDPEYEVFPMSLTGMIRKRKSSYDIKCTLSLNGKEIKLNLKSTPQYLASKYVPVWSAVSDQHAYRKIRYVPMLTAMSSVGDFTMYHDAENDAALAVYRDRTEKIVIEGIISSQYAIRSVPKRLIEKILEEVHNVTKIHHVMGGTIASAKDAGFYVVTKNREAPVSTTTRAVVTSQKPQQHTESVTSAESGHHAEGTTTSTTETTLPEDHEAAKPTERDAEEESEHHTERPTTTKTTLPENHEPTKPTEHDDEESEHHTERPTDSTAKSTLPENHETDESTQHDDEHESEHHERKKRAKYNKTKTSKTKLKLPKSVYSEMLIVLDHNNRHPTVTRALRRTLAFWNAMDLIYSKLDKPQIYLNIAGIIMAADDTATPYIAKNTSISSIGHLDKVLSNMGKYFYKESVRFPIKQYDTIVAMTTLNLCKGEVDTCADSKFLPGHSNELAVCSSSSDTKKTKTLKNTMIMHYDGKFGSEHISFVHHGDAYGNNTACVSKTHETTDDNPSFKWSDCSRKLHSRSLVSNKSECLRNKPLSIKPIGKVLPGRWLSIDGQCQNEGYAASCKLKKTVKQCAAKGCRAHDSNKCLKSKNLPLPGSECRTNKAGLKWYCSERKTCVRM